MTTCTNCGTQNQPGQKFCGECGTALAAAASQPVRPIEPHDVERRLVSILFADLVGFTSLSESRDTEDTREFLSRYFETCERLRARLHDLRGEQVGVERFFATAAGFFTESEQPFWLAVTRLEHAGWLAAQGRSADAEPLLQEARATFEQLAAALWLERVDRAAQSAVAV